MIDTQQPVLAADPDVFTTAEIAAKLRLSAPTVRRMANAGQLPALKSGKNYRYSWTAVQQLMWPTCDRTEGPQADRPGDDQPTTGTVRKGAGRVAQRQAMQAVREAVSNG